MGSSSKKKVISPLLSIGILILVWFVAAEIVSSNLLLPGPAETFEGLWKIVTSIDGWETILETCAKAFAGLFIALGMALVSGFVMGLVEIVTSYSNPL